MSAPAGRLPLLLLRAATEVAEGVQAGLAARGFDDVRPSHGLAFARIGQGGASVVDLAAQLGITKQASSQLVEQLVQRGYVERELNPGDGRAWLLVLTSRGAACSTAAQAALADVVKRWRKQLDRTGLAAFEAALDAIVTPGVIRPAW